MAKDLAEILPKALDHYVSGCSMAWGAPPQDRTGPGRGTQAIGPNRQEPGATLAAADEIAKGHVLLATALLLALMAWVTRGKGDRAAVLKEIRESRRLGPKVATWVEAQEGRFGHQMAMIQRETAGGGTGKPATLAPERTGSGARAAREAPTPPKSPPPGRPRVVTREQAEKMLVDSGRSLDEAKDYVASFDGPITAREIPQGERFLRYHDNAVSKGSFLTKQAFSSPREAVEALYLKPFNNGAQMVQNVVATKSTTVLEGAVAGGLPPGSIQTLILDRSAFSIGTGVRYP